MSTKQMEKFENTIKIPEKVKATLVKHMLHVEGPLGKTHKSFRKIPVNLEINESNVVVKAQGIRKRDYSILNTATSIIRNMCQGVVEGYTIKMKIVYAHFPITVKTKDDLVLIENFQGERAPRIAKIQGKTKAVPKGDDITITGHVLTDVTQTAANIQQITRVKGKDHRVFLDGIYVFEKNTGIEK